MPQGLQILDIGTASGTLARRCNVCGHHWRGLEPVAAWGEMARPFYEEFLIGRIENAPDEFLSPVEFVILGDILEHLPEPKVVLQRLVALQRKGTFFAISVPNIANIYIRLNLLMGRFEYMEHGILDRTHLRFFTRKSLEQMLTNCGLGKIEMKATPMPLNLIHPFFENTRVGKCIHHLLAKITSFWPTLFGYQFVVLAQKTENKETTNGF